NPATASSTLTLAASSTATTGTFSVVVTGTSGSLTGSTTVSVMVTAVPNSTLFASPSSLGIPQGASGTSTVSVTPENGFPGSVSLAAPGLPKCGSAPFRTNPATASSTVTLTASSTATTGTFSVVVTGTSGSLTNTTTVAFMVTAVSTALPLPWSDGDVGTVG